MKAAIFDFDGVFTEESSAVEYMKYLAENGAFREESLLEIKKTLEKYFDGKLSYQETNDITGKEWLKGIEGKKNSELKRLAEEFVENFEFDKKGKKVKWIKLKYYNNGKMKLKHIKGQMDMKRNIILIK